MTDPLTSKTFLARLCEQAERYDGKIHGERGYRDLPGLM
jgi:hypothetical protein